MKIFAISDISWNLVYLQELTRQIDKIRPDLVLLAGDLVNDMFGMREGKFFSAEQYWDDVYKLFTFLNERKIQVFCVRGNWDNSKQFDKVLKRATKNLKYIEDISERVVTHKDLRILGLSHAFTNDLEEVRLLSKKFRKQVDIVLAHAEYKRRIWLFHLNTKLIITGHFDSQLCQIQDKVFVSFGSFPSQYAIIDYDSTELKIRYINKEISANVLRRAKFSDGELIWRAKPIRSLRLHSEKYANQVERLMEAKTKLESDNTKRKTMIDELVKYGVPKRHIEEYLRINIRSKSKTR